MCHKKDTVVVVEGRHAKSVEAIEQKIPTMKVYVVQSSILTLLLASLMALVMPRKTIAFSTSSHRLITKMNLHAKHEGADMTLVNNDDMAITHRRQFTKILISSICLTSSTLMLPSMAMSDDAVQITAKGDVAKLFNEARAFEAQGNILAAQRLYLKVTNIAPRFIYGWSNLGNTLVAQGQLSDADSSYSKAVSLCEESLKQTEDTFGTRRCDDLYLILLNRGSVRLNNDMPKEALSDLTKSYTLRGRPDATVLQNLARAQEINSLHSQSDKSYTTAISMTANEVNPFWLRSSMVKYQLGDVNGAMDLMKRVSNRVPEAPEVRAAYAVLLWGKGEEVMHVKSF